MNAPGEPLALGPDTWGPGARPDPLADPGHEDRLLGAPVSRLDGALKVTGSARFAAEVELPGMVYAAVAYATIPKGRIAELDVSEAERAPGVVLVMTHRNAPRLTPPPEVFSAIAVDPVAGDDLPVMQDDRIHWNGQPIAVVLARTQEQADHACALIQAGYETERAVTSFADAVAQGTRTASFLGQPLREESGDAEEALAAAPHKVDAVYRTPRHNHNAIEPHAATLSWDGDELTVHDCSQAVRGVARISEQAWSACS